MLNVVFCIALSLVYYLNVSFSRLINSAGLERASFSPIDHSYFRMSSSSSVCLEKDVLCYCGTLVLPWPSI